MFQGFLKCATRLHKFGYRIPQVRGESSQKENAPEKDKLLEELLLPGREEHERQKMLLENPDWDDQVTIVNN